MKPLVDIITSAFNCDDFIEGYFIDLTSQTFFKQSTLTIVAPRPSAKLTKLTKFYQRQYENINLISINGDHGISSCLNIALLNTKAPFINIANTDDRKRKDAIERLFLSIYLDDTIDLVYARSLVSKFPNQTFEAHTCDQLYPCYEFAGLRGLMKHNSPHCSPLWRRSIHEKVGFFDEELKSCADSDMWMKAAANGSQFKMVDEILGIYYDNPNGMSTRAEDWREREQEIKRKNKRYERLLE